MRRFTTVSALLSVLALVAIACGEQKDTGFPAPGAVNTADPCATIQTPEVTEPVEEIFIAAENIEFTREEMLLQADTQVTIEFLNCDVAPHNVSIYAGDDASAEPILQEDPFAGVATVTYTVPPTEPGSYYFQCDVHPNMNGTARFE